MVQPEVDPQPPTVYGPKEKIILNSVFVSTFFFLFIFCQAPERRGNLQTKVRVSCDKCTVLFFLWSEYNQTVFVPFRKRRQALPKKKKKKKSVRSSEKKNTLLIPIYVFITVFFFFFF